jgi:hypothetical protein
MDNRRRSKARSADRGRDGDRYRRVAPYGRRVPLQDISPPPHGNNALEEKETMQGSWDEQPVEGQEAMSKTIDIEDTCYTVEGFQGRQFTTVAIVIEPLPEDLLRLSAHHSIAFQRALDAITIVPHNLSPDQLEQGMNHSRVDVDPLTAKPFDHCIVHATKAVTPPISDPPPAVETATEETVEQMQGIESRPQNIDQAIQQQGRDINELLQMFKQANSNPLSPFIMQTPKHKSREDIGNQQELQRKSPRQQAKNSAGKTMIKRAHELIAKNCGFLEEGKELDNMTLQQYLNMYKNPLSEETMEAIIKLTQVTEEKKKSKKEGKKKKEVAEDVKHATNREGRKKNNKATSSKLAEMAA